MFEMVGWDGVQIRDGNQVPFRHGLQQVLLDIQLPKARMARDHRGWLVSSAAAWLLCLVGKENKSIEYGLFSIRMTEIGTFIGRSEQTHIAFLGWRTDID